MRRISVFVCPFPLFSLYSVFEVCKYVGYIHFACLRLLHCLFPIFGCFARELYKNFPMLFFGVEVGEMVND